MDGEWWNGGSPALADGDSSTANAVNNRGQVVGWSSGLDFSQHATMWVCL